MKDKDLVAASKSRNRVTCFSGQHLAGWSGRASAAPTYVTLLNAKIEANARI